MVFFIIFLAFFLDRFGLSEFTYTIILIIEVRKEINFSLLSLLFLLEILWILLMFKVLNLISNFYLPPNLLISILLSVKLIILLTSFVLIMVLFLIIVYLRWRINFLIYNYILWHSVTIFSILMVWNSAKRLVSMLRLYTMLSGVWMILMCTCWKITH